MRIEFKTQAPFNKNNLVKSAQTFRELIWPYIKKYFFNGELIPVESEYESALAVLLDTKAGIDTIVECQHGLIGLSLRTIQGENYRSFTMNSTSKRPYEYELAKRIVGEITKLSSGYVVQSYIYTNSTKKQMLSVGICKTAELAKFIIDDKLRKERLTTEKVSPENTKFIIVPWGVYSKTGNTFFTETFEL